MKTHETREAWFGAAVKKLRKIFKDFGYDLPKLRIGCGWPVLGRECLGECHPKENSKDKTYEIFISPKLDSPVFLLAVMIHELCHAVVGVDIGHKKPWDKMMETVGMVGTHTAFYAGEELRAKLVRISKKLGSYPHASLMIGKKPLRDKETFDLEHDARREEDQLQNLEEKHGDQSRLPGDHDAV